MAEPAQPPFALALGGLRISRIDPVAGSRFTLYVPGLEIGAGMRIGIVGPSGSGKTTLLQMLGLLGWPDGLDYFALGLEGQVLDVAPFLAAKDVSVLSKLRSEHMAFVMQDGGLLPYLTVLENAALACELSQKRVPRRGPLLALAKRIGLAAQVDRLPAKLSGGQRQRAAVLRAMATEPKILFADEPTAALDRATSRDVMETLVDNADAASATLVMVSHDERLLRDNGFALLRAEILQEGVETEVVFSEPEHAA